MINNPIIEEKPQIVYETTGNAKSYRVSIAAAKEAVILFGYTESDVCLDPYPIFDNELVIYGSKWLTVEDLQAVVNLIDQGALKTKSFISAELPFEDYGKGIEMIQNGQAIKVVMKP